MLRIIVQLISSQRLKIPTMTDTPTGTAGSGILRFEAPAHSAFVFTYDLR